MKKFLIVSLLMSVTGFCGYYIGTGKVQVTEKSVSVR